MLMKTSRFIILFAAAGFLLSACDRSSLEYAEPGATGATVEIGSAQVVAPTDVYGQPELTKSGEWQSQPVTVLDDPETGSFLEITTTVGLMDYDLPETRVSEVTTANLSKFSIEGYLGDEILTCKFASDEDKNNRHFIDGLTVEKDTDGYWYFPGDAPKWRSCVDHHFWAYKGTPASLTVSGQDFDQASFSYTNSGGEDLVMGYQHQMWVDEVEGTVGSEDAYPLNGLRLKHAMTELVIDCSSIVMKMLNANGGAYIDIPRSDDPQFTGLPDDLDHSKLNPRLKITEVLLLTPSKATCSLTVGDNGVDFDWDCPLIVNGNAEGYTTCKCDGTAPSSIFVIPQNLNGNVLVLNVYDSWRNITTPIFVEIPKLSGGAEWQPGYRYKYKITGTLVAPYCSPLGNIDPGFKGKDWQSYAVLKNLLSKYVKKVRLTWKGLPAVNSNSTPCAVIYLDSTEKPSATTYPMPDYASISWYNKDNVGFVASVAHNVVEGVKKGSATIGANQATAECTAEFIIPDNLNPPLTFYLLYDGDNNGNALWILKEAKIEVVEFKYPIQTL